MTHPINQCPVCFDSGTMCEHCLSHRVITGAIIHNNTTGLHLTGGSHSPFNIADGPHEVQTAFVDDLPVCRDCIEFGTICRPCRKARYEAARAPVVAAERRALRFRIWSSVALGVAVLLLGLFLQSRWDAHCAAEQPGTRWNGDLWACEVAR